MSNFNRILCLALLLGLLTQGVHADTAAPIGSPHSAGSSNSSNHQPDWEDCVAFRKKVINSKKSKEILDELFLKIDEDDFCAKNILGILHAKGVHVEKDFEKSYAIFHNLSEKNYPPSQLNLALLLAKKEGHSSETLINLLIGIIVKYTDYTETEESCWFFSGFTCAMGEEWAHIAGSARRFAQKYVDELPLPVFPAVNAYASGAHISACEEIGFTPGTDRFDNCVLELQTKAHEGAARTIFEERELRATLATRLREATTVSGMQLSTRLVNKNREQKETIDGIVLLISLGVLAYQASVPTRVPNTYYPQAPDPFTFIPPKPQMYYFSGGGSPFAR